MSEKPIISNAEMVRAILDGRKTQTRRAIETQPEYKPEGGYHWYQRRKELGLWDQYTNDDFVKKCPYGQPGDILWMRETFTIESSFNMDPYPLPFTDGRPTRHHSDDVHGDYWEQPHYRATDKEPELCYDDMDGPGCRWRPSIHMPRWASRIQLLINRVWVERVQDIGEDNAKAEGVIFVERETDGGNWEPCAVDQFKLLWNSIYAKRGYSWKSNPWVWAIEFEVIT